MVYKGNIASLCYILQIYQPQALGCSNRIFLLVILGEWVCLSKLLSGIFIAFLLFMWAAEFTEGLCCLDFFPTTPCSDASGDGDN